MQSCLAPRKDADGNSELDGDDNQLYSNKRRPVFEKQNSDPPEFFRTALKKRTQGRSKKVTQFLAGLKRLAKMPFPNDSWEIREHLFLQDFLERLLNQSF